jgi:bifunctional UDP-N-acetylglucosamine pyrophosphorylase/glucosamine-1-phosphate N-acetyltransferase
VRCVIAAAGKGSRSGMSIPKTLCQVGGLPIIVRLLNTVKRYDQTPIIIASPDGSEHIDQVIRRHGCNAEFVIQSSPRGMGDAVLQIARLTSLNAHDEVLLIWGDVPFAQTETIDELLRLHHRDRNVLSFPTRRTDNCYTYVERSDTGQVRRVVETREQAGAVPSAGERDTGIFVFNRQLILEALKRGGDEAIGRTTGEHGFLYVIGQLASEGHAVEGYPIASELDAIGFNTPDDLREIAARGSIS